MSDVAATVQREGSIVEAEGANPSLLAREALLCILYCEFDPHKGPRPVFQVPKDFVSAEVCEMLSDHLIASSELCGHLIGVTAFGLQFVGHPEYIRDERYERNQFMFNVCFVFDALTDVGAYRALISKVAKDFRTIETNHRFLSSHETRDRIEEVISGILSDIKRTGQLHMPPTGVEDIPISSESIGSDSLLLQHGPMLDKLPEVHAHEVPVWVAPSQDCSEYLPAYPFLAQLMPFFTEDGRTGGSDVASIARRTAQPLAQVINLVAVLTQRGAVRLVDRISMTNVYVCTRALSELPGDGSLRTQCVQECRATGANSAPLFSAAYEILCKVDPSKSLAEVVSLLPRGAGGAAGGGPKGAGANGGGVGGRGHDGIAGDIDVLRLIRFARVHRLLRRIHHWPVWMGPETAAASGARAEGGASGGGAGRRAEWNGGYGAIEGRGGGKKDRGVGNRELSAKILAWCNGMLLTHARASSSLACVCLRVLAYMHVCTVSLYALQEGTALTGSRARWGSVPRRCRRSVREGPTGRKSL